MDVIQKLDSKFELLTISIIPFHYDKSCYYVSYLVFHLSIVFGLSILFSRGLHALLKC